MQLHSQLPELREGGAGRGEDLSNLGAEQHYGGPAARRPSPASDPPAPRPARTSRQPGRGPTLPWPPGSAVREGGRTLVDADVMAPRTFSRRRSAATTTRAGNHGEPGGRPLGSRAGSPALLAADWPKSDFSHVTRVASLRGGRREGRRRLTSGWLQSTSVEGSGLLVEAKLSLSKPRPAPSLQTRTPGLGESLLFIVVQGALGPGAEFAGPRGRQMGGTDGLRSL